MDVAQLRLTLGFNGDGNGVESAFCARASPPRLPPQNQALADERSTIQSVEKPLPRAQAP